jgi:hypothetical protein
MRAHIDMDNPTTAMQSSVGKTSDISLQAEGVAETRRVRTRAQASLINAL